LAEYNNAKRLGKMYKRGIEFNSILLLFSLLSISLVACARGNTAKNSRENIEVIKLENSIENNIAMENNQSGNRETETATFGAGCFWCVEAQFQQLAGVKEVISGYMGGHVKNPTYEQVCTGETGHAEVANIVYYPDSISFDKLLEAFFVAHDPTQLNRQGNDVGTQYRSAIFYHNESQKKKAEFAIKRLNEEKAYPNPIVTVVAPYSEFYKAEDYHTNYYKLNPKNPYCQMVVRPKAEKFKQVFKELIRE
jgi:peptide-methionine (S)-S-oxide reductase